MQKQEKKAEKKTAGSPGDVEFCRTVFRASVQDLFYNVHRYTIEGIVKRPETGGLTMWKEVVTETGIIFYLMLGVGVVGIFAKVMNYVTLRKLVSAAGSMSKSTHKLMKLVRAKYEHACMVHDRVENVNAFVEKYIYEYRGFLLKIHTWRQIQIQAIWFAGILAAVGAVGHFMTHGFCEQVYQYGALGAAEMIALFVISQLSDESYKIEAAENYMVDYLENVCAHRCKRMRKNEKNLEVIRSEAAEPQKLSGAQKASQRAAAVVKQQDNELSINIEEEPKKFSKELEKAVKQETEKEKQEEPAFKEDAIRQILEEFLA